MKKLLILCLTFMIATELEVDGNLKVTGDIDASGNAIKNIGLPTTLNDAINGNVLQNALRDDGPFEYEFYKVVEGYNPGPDDFQYWKMGDSCCGSWTDNFIMNVLAVKLPLGWEIYHQSKISDTSCNGASCGQQSLFILRKSIESED